MLHQMAGTTASANETSQSTTKEVSVDVSGAKDAVNGLKSQADALSSAADSVGSISTNQEAVTSVDGLSSTGNSRCKW